jgi:4-amino-4-deoxy-L-arabinose transferase-like glycosyltransferase
VIGGLGGGFGAFGGGTPPTGGTRPTGVAGRTAAAGGGSTASQGLIAYLEAHRNGAQYLVAAFTSQSSSPIIIASGQPVITIGGFNGADPAPTLAEFEKLVAQGKVRYVLVETGTGGAPGGSNSLISSWVTSHGTQIPASSYGGSTGAGTLYLVSAT